MDELRAEDAERVLLHAGQQWRQHLLPALEQALATLPEHLETTLELLYQHGATVDDVTDLLALPGGAADVESMRQEALTHLKQHLAPPILTFEDIEALLRLYGEGHQAIGAETHSEQAVSLKEAKLQRSQLLRGDRPPLRLVKSPLRRVLAAACVFMIVYSGLWFGGWGISTDVYHQASIQEYRTDLMEALRNRDNTETNFERAARALSYASSRKWYFVRDYNQERVAIALVHLEYAYEEWSDPFLRTKAAFFLAKAHLMRGEANDRSEAEAWLQRALDQNAASPYRQHAEQLLNDLRTS